MTESVADINEANGDGAAPPSHDDDWFRKVLLPTIGRYVHAQVRPLQRRIEELESQTKNWEYRDVFESGEVYYENNFVTHQGSLWVCKRSTVTKPGTDSSWVLCCKRGKDAR